MARHSPPSTFRARAVLSRASSLAADRLATVARHAALDCGQLYFTPRHSELLSLPTRRLFRLSLSFPSRPDPFLSSSRRVTPPPPLSGRVVGLVHRRLTEVCPKPCRFTVNSILPNSAAHFGHTSHFTLVRGAQATELFCNTASNWWPGAPSGMSCILRLASRHTVF